MQNIFEKLLNNLVVAAFIPSLVFCSALLLLFMPYISQAISANIVAIFQEFGILVLGVSFVISLFLVYIRESIFDLYRGDDLPDLFSHLEINRANKMKNKIHLLEQRLEELSNTNESHEQFSEAVLMKISALTDELYMLVSEYQANFPAIGRANPTRLGNILRAAETRIAQRYSLDPVVLWPYLGHLIPASNLQKIDDSFNQLSFLINSSVLSGMLFIVCFIFSTRLQIQSGSWNSLYSYISLVSLLCAFLFYKFSLPIAKNYAQMYCVAFDLFRFEILKQFCLDLPKNSEEEVDAWHHLCYLLAVGSYFGEINLEYHHNQKSTMEKH